jgi:prepilin-type processing-associated H-X9-DG protein
MNTKKCFTKMDVLVTAICFIFLAVNLPVLCSSGKNHAKIDVCKANLMQLMSAWQLYAEDNSGNLVNGAPTPGTVHDPRRNCDSTVYPGCDFGSGGCSSLSCNRKAFAPQVCSDDPIFCSDSRPWHWKELPWIGPAWKDLSVFYPCGGPAPQDCQKCAIETGALWKYVRQYNIYKCPVGAKGELATYQIIDGMNGVWHYRYNDSGNAATVKSLCYKNMGQIKKSSQRVVFIDAGCQMSDSYSVRYDRPYWYDYPPVRHGNGTLLSFADGHTELWQWKAQETINSGKQFYSNPCVPPPFLNPVTCDGINDLYKMQTGCWGAIGYTPAIPPNCALDTGV